HAPRARASRLEPALQRDRRARGTAGRNAGAGRTRHAPSATPRRRTAADPRVPHRRRKENLTMKAVTWHGTHDVRVDNVDDPTIEHPTDAIVRITSTGICGSDLHLYEVLAAFIDPGDILGHEPMGVVEDVGSEVENIKPG